MKTFKDLNGVNWTISVTVDTIKRVRDLCDLDLLTFADKEQKSQLLIKLDDPCTLAGVLYAVCKPEIDQRGMSPEAFGQSLGGDVIDEASTALVYDLIDFFPSRKRQILHKAFRRVLEVGERRMNLEYNRALEQIESPEFQEALEKAFEQQPSGS